MLQCLHIDPQLILNGSTQTLHNHLHVEIMKYMKNP
jgi:hypothetical protein